LASNARRPYGATLTGEPILAQGVIEKAFPAETACTARVRFAKADSGQEGPRGRFYLDRGIAIGELMERELESYAHERGLTIDLGGVVDEIVQQRRIQLPDDQLAEIRTAAITWGRQWQAAFPPADDPRPWDEVVSLLHAQTDLFVRRPERFAIRVRPDNVVGVGTTIVAVEWSTAKDPASISPARIALNHHALLRERLRRPEWEPYTALATRVELLALGIGYTVQLTPEVAEAWRLKIGTAAEAIVAGHYEATRGPWCSICPWQAPCWFATDEPVAF
jgi:hypothetical protein